MANLLTVEHARPGEHLQLSTLNEPVRAVAVPYGKRIVLAVQLVEGSRLELKTSGGTLPVVTVAGIPVMTAIASTVLGHGQTVQLETPMGTLAVRGWDPGVAHPDDEPEPEAFGSLDPISELSGGELPPPTRP